MSEQDKVKELEDKIRFLTSSKCACPGKGHESSCHVTLSACYEAAAEQNRKLLAGECIGKEPCDEWDFNLDEQVFCSVSCQQRAILNYITGSRSNWISEVRMLRQSLSEHRNKLSALIGDCAVVLEPMSINIGEYDYSPALYRAIREAVTTLRSTVEWINKPEDESWRLNRDLTGTEDLETRIDALRCKLKKSMNFLRIIEGGAFSVRTVKEIREFIADSDSKVDLG